MTRVSLLGVRDLFLSTSHVVWRYSFQEDVPSSVSKKRLFHIIHQEDFYLVADRFEKCFCWIFSELSLDTLFFPQFLCNFFSTGFLASIIFVCVHTNALIFIVLLALVPITGCRSQNLLVSCMMLNNISVLGGAPLSTMSSNTAMAPAGPYLVLSFSLFLPKHTRNWRKW